MGCAKYFLNDSFLPIIFWTKQVIKIDQDGSFQGLNTCSDNTGQLQMKECKLFCQFRRKTQPTTIGADGNGTDVPWKVEFLSEITNRPTNQPTNQHINPYIDRPAVQTCGVHLRDLDQVPPPPTGNSITHSGGQRSAAGWGGDQYLEEGDTDGVRWRELGLHVTRQVLCFYFFFSLSRVKVMVVVRGAMGGGTDEEKCDLARPSATNGGFDLPAKSRCCYALFQKMEWKDFIFNPFCSKHPWFSC